MSILALLMLAADLPLFALGNRHGNNSEIAPLPEKSERPKPWSVDTKAASQRAPVTATGEAAVETVDRQQSEYVPAVPESWNAGIFNLIEWWRFESVVEDLFQQTGFETRTQSHGADEGVDVWLYSGNQPGQPVSLVQCKNWRGKRVGVDKIRELRGVMAAHGVRRGQFATTSSFTSDAVAFALGNGINLLDVGGLLNLISQRTPEQQAKLMLVVLEGEYWRPTCGIKMTRRVPRGAALFGVAPTIHAARRNCPGEQTRWA